VAHSIGLEGRSVRIVATDGRPWPTGPASDTLWVGPGEKYDVLVEAGPRGVGVRDGTNGPYAGPMVGAPAAATGSSPTTNPSPSPLPAGGGVAAKSFVLYVRSTTLTFPDGAHLSTLGLTDDPTGSAQVPGPALRVTKGDTVQITVVNDAGIDDVRLRL